MKERSKDKKDFSDAVGAFIYRHRIVFIVGFAAIILGLAGFTAWMTIRSGIESAATVEAEKAEELFAKWKGEPDQAKKDALEAELVAAIDASISGIGFSSDRASMIKGDLLAEKKAYSDAEKAYFSIFERNPKSPFVTKALINASAMAELEGDTDKAISRLMSLVDSGNDLFAFGDFVYFNIGRLQVAKKEYEQARASFEKVRLASKVDYWKSLADTAILNLRISGFLK